MPQRFFSPQPRPPFFFGLTQENYQTSVPLVGNKQSLLSLKPTVEVVLRFTRFHFLNT
jgi:hypothetical protein